MQFKFLRTIAILTVSLFLQSVYALDFHIRYIDNDAKDFESRGWLNPSSLFQRNVIAATKILGNQINSTETIELIVVADSSALRAGGGGTFWPYLYTDKDGIDVWQDGSLSRAMLGINDGNRSAYPYDIQVTLNTAFVDQYYWIEQEPETRSGNIPFNKGDFVSVVMHELIHGFGFNGFRKRIGQDYGTYYYSTKSVFDSMTFFGGNGTAADLSGQPNPLFFDGPEIRKVYGSAIALAHYAQSNIIYAPSNYYHFGDCTSPAVLKASLMNGCVFPNGIKLNPTPIDLAVLADIGYPVKGYSTAVVAIDTDQDGIIDSYEDKYGLNKNSADANGDLDGDGLSNLSEFIAGSYANQADSDNDGMTDDWEVRHALNPVSASDALLDTDMDGFSNKDEYFADRDPKLDEGIDTLIATIAVYSQLKLSVPSMKFGTKFYALEFKLIKENPLVLELVNMTERKIKLLEVAHIPEFKLTTSVLSIPRVQTGNASYEVGLQLINSNPIQIQLVSASKLP